MRTDFEIKTRQKKSGEAQVVFWAEVEATTTWLLLASPFFKNPIPDKETYRFAFASLTLWCEGRGHSQLKDSILALRVSSKDTHGA